MFLKLILLLIFAYNIIGRLSKYIIAFESLSIFFLFILLTKDSLKFTLFHIQIPNIVSLCRMKKIQFIVVVALWKNINGHSLFHSLPYH